MEIRNIIKENYLLNRVFVSDDNVKALNNLASYTSVQYKDFKFKSGEEYNGWVIPDKWQVIEAKILKDGQTVYNGQAHPLGVIANSSSFQDRISKEELIKHIHTAPERPKAIPFHFRLQYRPWVSDWGFCMPKEKFDSLEEGEYEVKLETILEPGEMVVREFTIPGQSEDTIIFVAHIDHPGLTNDDLSGCAVGIELLNKIKEKYSKSKYTYKLLLTQEICGSVFYLEELSKVQRENIKYSLFLEMLGNDNILNLQKSFLGNTLVDKACILAMREFFEEPGKLYSFRESVGNDEIVFEAPGIEIPMPTLSRFPYPEYHTSDDNMDIIHEENLQEALKILLEIVGVLEKNVIVKRQFIGLISLSNPKYDLYIDPGQILSTSKKEENKQKSLFQYKMPRYLEGNYTIIDIALEFNIKFNWLFDYFQRMKEKGLAIFEECQLSDRYKFEDK